MNILNIIAFLALIVSSHSAPQLAHDAGNFLGGNIAKFLCANSEISDTIGNFAGTLVNGADLISGGNIATVGTDLKAAKTAADTVGNVGKLFDSETFTLICKILAKELFAE